MVNTFLHGAEESYQFIVILAARLTDCALSINNLRVLDEVWAVNAVLLARALRSQIATSRSECRDHKGHDLRDYASTPKAISSAITIPISDSPAIRPEATGMT